MALGFVLIAVEPNHENEVYRELLKVPEVQELHPLFGEYDFIAKIEASDYDTLGHVVVTKLRALEGVRETQTLAGTKF